MVCAWEWFPENKSIVTGSILVANGLGQLLYGAVSTAIVNPTNGQIRTPCFIKA